MYMPRQFEEQRTEVLHGLIDAHPLGTLVTMRPGGLEAEHVPFLLDRDAGPHGTLRAHVARANPVWREAEAAAGCLVVFQGADAYVSPSVYPGKAEHGREVPTWNYMAVHARGALRAIHDPAWLLDLLRRLSDRHEQGRAHPWRVSDAPAEYIDKLLAAIVGIEIPVESLQGKWKTSQNRPAADRAAVARDMRQRGSDAEVAMALAVESR